jgi:AmmeMemoRadiSam system protein B/AmmeMemoRadiSam system protein A
MKNWKAENSTRKAAVAGTFYPGEKRDLERELLDLFQNSKKKRLESLPLQAIISPHAGYVFSGKVAASAYNQISENAVYKRVFVLASSHRMHFKGASVYIRGDYETPLGNVKVDKTLGQKLIKSSDIFLDKPEAHLHEHSLEVQLPFLQHKLGNSFQLIPIVLGTNSAADCKLIAEALKPYFVTDNLFVVSTDFSHYPNYDAASKIDYLTANAICENKTEDLRAALERNKSAFVENLSTSLCGWTSVLTLLYLTEGREYKYMQIDYQNSGDAKRYGDKERVVGYWSIVVYDENVPFVITAEEKTELLEKARSSITNYLKTGKKGKAGSPKSDGILKKKTGVFVSVYVNDELRGCIGGFAQDKSLNHLLHQMAIAALGDRRFDKVQPEELENMTLEISVLSPLKKITSAEEIELGRHGIFIRKGLNTGTFLPQVADKTGWNRAEFLGRCSRDKAGLGWEGWKTAELFTYEAIIIKEET